VVLWLCAESAGTGTVRGPAPVGPPQGNRRVRLIVNGEPHTHRGDGRIGSLMEEIGVDPKAAAVMLNDDVITASCRDSIKLKDGDTVELIVFASGG